MGSWCGRTGRGLINDIFAAGKRVCKKTCELCGEKLQPCPFTTTISPTPPAVEGGAGCRDPFTSDPESWDCTCHKTMVNATGMTDFTSAEFSARYRSLLCKHPKVCNSWKRKVCCIDDDGAVKKESGGKYSNCAAVKASCRDPKIGGVVRLHCPKTCRMCPLDNADEANDEDLQDAISLSEDEETAAAWPKPNAWSTPKAGATPSPTSNPKTQKVAKQADMCLAM